MFRLIALAIPFFALVLLESVLRSAGYGYPTAFFLKYRQNDDKVLVENPRFGWRFFPPALARSPQPLLLHSSKPAGTVRIFLFGESAAMGDPEPAYGFGRQLQRILQGRHPLNRIEVVNVAMTAINSHVIRQIARDCAPRQGDLWLIYAGNNEVVGPFGAGTVFGPQAPSLVLVRSVLAAKSFRIGQWLSGLRSDSRTPKEWQGMELFLNNQVDFQDTRLRRIYDSFSANLSAVVQMGRKAGAKVVLATMPANLKDCPPFGSTHPAHLTASDLKTWQKQFDVGRQAEAEHRYQEALQAYSQAVQIDDNFAQLIYSQGRCELALGEGVKAKADFSRARDLDTLRFRADSRINQIIHEVAATQQTVLVDTEAELARRAAGEVSGDEQFCDHVHLNFSGNYLVAILLAAQVESQLFANASPAIPFPSQAEIAHQLAFTDFDQRRVGEEMRLRLQQPPFSGQSNFKERDQHWQELLSRPHSTASDAVWEYRAALALNPQDWVLRQNFGRLLETLGDANGAAAEWAQVTELLPHEPEGYFHLGNLAFDEGKYDFAKQQFRQALRLRPGAEEALNGLGLVLAAEGQTNEAMTQFQSALEKNARFSAARINMATFLAKLGQQSNAIAEFQTTLRLDTNNVGARINLGKLLFRMGQTNEANDLYAQALQLSPENPIAQYDFGNALAAQGRHAEAATHYAAAAQLQPMFADAQYNLALELARLGQINDAAIHFAEAVRLNPTFVEGHFNYGVALAKLQRFSEATQQFQETLKLDSNHPSARVMLNRTLMRGASGQKTP